jgi:xylulokinase
MRDLYLAIDVGTGGLRAALVDRSGHILAYAHQEHEQIVPQFSWSEQRPMEWWTGTIASIRTVLEKIPNASARVAAICTCGQMHGTVLVDERGELMLDAVPLWNDKRTVAQVDAFKRRVSQSTSLSLAANIPAPAWPAFKLIWIKDNHPDVFTRTRHVLMPKDWINFKLTGAFAQDYTEASLSFLMDWKTREWSDALCDLTGLPRAILPQLRQSYDVLDGLSRDAAKLLGLAEGIPVLVGAGDYPMALLGSGVIASGMGSDVTGTSSIITILRDDIILDDEAANVLMPNGKWGVMTLVDAGGDAIRWARRALHNNKLSYDEIEESAAKAPAGSNCLFFLPYLSGERIAQKPNSRAQYFGLKAEHTMHDLHRAVMEGVAFSVRLKLDRLDDGKAKPKRIVAASGGAKSNLWLKIKASLYNVPYVMTQEAECGVIGAAMTMACALCDCRNYEDAAKAMVRYTDEIKPDPEWVELYDKMMPIYARLYEHSKSFYDDLDQLDEKQKGNNK